MLSDFVHINDLLNPYIVVVAFPRGMNTPFPDDRVTTWFLGENSDRVSKRALSLGSWMDELVKSEKLLTIRDAHKCICEFLGWSDANIIIDEVHV